ncbi:hypothetical protein SAMD00019534_066090, partial [Acytostelium subglobosum LB1]|uniref:hypothetical protein n=1 Tax=Acytostelium subglobosum LB1 TaxID=1410327 RepID=UPI000644AB4E
PAGLTTLNLGSKFNQPITKHSLPSTLSTLIFGMEHDQPIEVGALPHTLTYLLFGNNFNQALPAGTLPDSITTLSIDGKKFHQPTTSVVLPISSLIHVIVRSWDQLVHCKGVPKLTITHAISYKYVNKFKFDHNVGELLLDAPEGYDHNTNDGIQYAQSLMDMFPNVITILIKYWRFPKRIITISIRKLDKDHALRVLNKRNFPPYSYKPDHTILKWTSVQRQQQQQQSINQSLTT